MDGFFGVDIARKALAASQAGMEVTSHNIANANTPGYSRQRAMLATTQPFPAPYWNRPLTQGQMGTGVYIKSIDRVRNDYFDGQLRKENQSIGGWEVKQNALQQLETIFNEPSDTSLQNILGEFWNAWQQMSKNPESQSIRSSLIETAKTVCTTFNQLSDKVDRLQSNLNEQVAVKVDEVNNILDRIVALNKDILRVKTSDMQPNDLMDERDTLIDQLSKLADVELSYQDTGVVLVYLNGRQLVSEYDNQKLVAVANAGNHGYYDVKWASDNADATLYGGEIEALKDSRDVIAPSYISDLDTLANTVVTQVNTLHFAGYGLDGVNNRNFFDPVGIHASDIAVAITDPRQVAAASSWVAPGNPGDNTNALAIAQLNNAMVMGGGSMTMNDYYRSIVTDLGIESQEAQRMTSNGKMYYDLIEKNRQSVSGVSLDEEATNMIKFQRAYEAASRVISVFDEMLDTLINRMVR